MGIVGKWGIGRCETEIVVLPVLAANRHAKHVALSRVAYFRANWEIAKAHGGRFKGRTRLKRKQTTIAGPIQLSLQIDFNNLHKRQTA